MESVKKVLFFDKESGRYMGVLESEELIKGINKELFSIKEVYMKPTEYWEGTYNEGRVYDRFVTPLVYEGKLLDQAYAEILASYPLYEQINHIIEVIENNKDVIKTTKGFDLMVKFINNRRLKLKQKIKHLSSDKKAFNFIRINEEDTPSIE